MPAERLTHFHPHRDWTHFKRGKLPQRHDPLTLRLADYLPEKLPRLPQAQDWTGKLTQVPPQAGDPSFLGYYYNDSLGDCTCAGVAHMIQVLTSNSGKQLNLPPEVVLNLYETVGKYVPGKAKTDNGCVELDVLNYWRKHGVGGHQIAAYAKIDQLDVAQVQYTLDLFGAIYIGLALPLTMNTQTSWEVVLGDTVGQMAPGSDGGHCVIIVGYDQTGLTCITWGQFVRMSWAFFFAYCDEAYAVITKDWIKENGKDPQGLDLKGLMSDLKKILSQE